MLIIKKFKYETSIIYFHKTHGILVMLWQPSTKLVVPLHCKENKALVTSDHKLHQIQNRMLIHIKMKQFNKNVKSVPQI